MKLELTALLSATLLAGCADVPQPTSDAAYTTETSRQLTADVTPLYPSALRVGVRRYDLAAPAPYDNGSWADPQATDADRQLGRAFAGVRGGASVEILTGPLDGAPYPRGWTADEVRAVVAAGGVHRSDQWMLVAVGRDALSSDGSDRETRERVAALASELDRVGSPTSTLRASELRHALDRFATDRDHRLGFIAATKLRLPAELPADFGCPDGETLVAEVTTTQTVGGGYDPVCWHWDAPLQGAAEACVADDVGERNLPSCTDDVPGPGTFVTVTLDDRIAEGEVYALDDGRTMLCTERTDAAATRADYLFVHDGEPARGGWVAGFFLSAPQCR